MQINKCWAYKCVLISGQESRKSFIRFCFLFFVVVVVVVVVVSFFFFGK